jgi:hypothetical protein
LAISNSETSPEDMSFHLALQVGHDVVTCIGVRVGERILSPSEMSHFVKNATPNHLSISCNVGADLGDLLATIDAQALSQSGTIRLTDGSSKLGGPSGSSMPPNTRTLAFFSIPSLSQIHPSPIGLKPELWPYTSREVAERS